MILIDVDSTEAVIRQQQVLTAGLVGAQVRFRFSRQWDTLSKVAVFRGGIRTCKTANFTPLEVDGQTQYAVTIPHEVLSVPGSGLQIGVYGVSLQQDAQTVTLAIPTVWAKTEPILPGADPEEGDAVTPPSPALWEQMLVGSQDATAAAQSAAAEANKAAFLAMNQAQSADEAAALAMEKAQDADEAAVLATEKAQDADQAAQSASTAANNATAAAQKATSAAGNANHAAQAAKNVPYIGESGNWYVYEEQAGEYQDTGTTAGIDAVRYTSQSLTQAQKSQAQENIGVCSFKETADKLCPAFTESGDIVTCEPVEGYPLQAVSQIQPVQEGSGDPSPENIRPITGHTVLQLTRCGKNLWGGDALANCIVAAGGTKDEAAGTVTFDPGTVVRSAIKFDRFKENTQYTFILYGRNTVEAASSFNMYIKYTDGTTFAPVGNNYTDSIAVDHYWRFTTPVGKSIQMLRVQWENGSTVLHYDKCGIFEGVVTLEEFEPYRGDTCTEEPGQTVYGGSYDWQTGVLTDDYIYHVFSGNEAWIYNVDVAENAYALIKIGALGSVTGNAISSHFIKKTISSSDKNIGFNVLNSNGYGSAIISMRIRAPFTLDEFKQWLIEQYEAGTPVTVAYQSTEPFTVPSTPRQTPALAGINNIWSNTGNTAVTGRADPVAKLEKLENAILALGGNI